MLSPLNLARTRLWARVAVVGSAVVLASTLTAGFGSAPGAGASTATPAHAAAPAAARSDEEYWVDWGTYETLPLCKTAGDVVLVYDENAIEYQCNPVYDGPKGEEKLVYMLLVLINQNSCIAGPGSGTAAMKHAAPAC